MGILLLGLVCGVAGPNARAQTPRAAHVIHVAVDGLGSVYLERLLSSAPSNFPNFVRLMSEGAATLNARCDFSSSVTIPNHASMLMGRPVQQPEGWPNTTHHGYTSDSAGPIDTFHGRGNTNVPYFASVFDVVHDHGLSTAFFAGKAKLAICYVSYNETNGAPDLVGPDNGRNKVDFAQTLEASVGHSAWELTSAVTNYLATNAPNYLFFHIADLDYAGHSYDWGSLAWSNTLAAVDGCLGSLLEALARDPILKGQTSIMLTSDHGGGSPPYWHDYPEERVNFTIPFLVWGPGWPAEADIYRLFENRLDPGTNRLDYTAPFQPLRNGDAANLALAMLGLPPVSGSSMLPRWGVPRVSPRVIKTGSALTISWPDPAGGFVLEATTRLTPPANWRTVTDGIADIGTVKTLTISNPPALGAQFFRLRRK